MAIQRYKRCIATYHYRYGLSVPVESTWNVATTALLLLRLHRLRSPASPRYG